MNASNASQYLPLVQALIEGKTVQFYNSYLDDWIDCKELDFSCPPERYRIKPEPREPQEFFIVRAQGTRQLLSIFLKRDHAEMAARCWVNSEIIRALEVL